jgi:hypothetical protein
VLRVETMRVRNGVNKDRESLPRRQALILKKLILFHLCMRAICFWIAKTLSSWPLKIEALESGGKVNLCFLAEMHCRS